MPPSPKPRCQSSCSTETRAASRPIASSAINELDMTVPADLSLIVYDESPAARFHVPPISALIRDSEQMGEWAAELVMERIDGRRAQLGKIVVPTRYVQRGT